MTTRPKHAPKTDTNHNIVPKVVRQLGYQFRGMPIRLIDTSKHGGNLTDWLVWIGPLAVMFEVKQPGEAKRLTDGEQETQSWRVPFAIVESEQDVVDTLTFYALLAAEIGNVMVIGG